MLVSNEGQCWFTEEEMRSFRQDSRTLEAVKTGLYAEVKQGSDFKLIWGGNELISGNLQPQTISLEKKAKNGTVNGTLKEYMSSGYRYLIVKQYKKDVYDFFLAKQSNNDGDALRFLRCYKTPGILEGYHVDNHMTLIGNKQACIGKHENETIETVIYGALNKSKGLDTISLAAHQLFDFQEDARVADYTCCYNRWITGGSWGNSKSEYGTGDYKEALWGVVVASWNDRLKKCLGNVEVEQLWNTQDELAKKLSSNPVTRREIMKHFKEFTTGNSHIVTGTLSNRETVTSGAPTRFKTYGDSNLGVLKADTATELESVAGVTKIDRIEQGKNNVTLTQLANGEIKENRSDDGMKGSTSVGNVPINKKDLQRGESGSTIAGFNRFSGTKLGNIKSSLDELNFYTQDYTTLEGLSIFARTAQKLFDALPDKKRSGLLTPAASKEFKPSGYNAESAVEEQLSQLLQIYNELKSAGLLTKIWDGSFMELRKIDVETLGSFTKSKVNVQEREHEFVADDKNKNSVVFQIIPSENSLEVKNFGEFVSHVIGEQVKSQEELNSVLKKAGISENLSISSSSVTPFDRMEIYEKIAKKYQTELIAYDSKSKLPHHEVQNAPRRVVYFFKDPNTRKITRGFPKNQVELFKSNIWKKAIWEGKLMEPAQIDIDSLRHIVVDSDSSALENLQAFDIKTHRLASKSNGNVTLAWTERINVDPQQLVSHFFGDKPVPTPNNYFQGVNFKSLQRAEHAGTISEQFKKIAEDSGTNVVILGTAVTDGVQPTVFVPGARRVLYLNMDYSGNISRIFPESQLDEWKSKYVEE